MKISDTDSPISYKTQLKLECIINSGNNSDRVTVKDLIIRGIKTRESVAIGSTGLASFCPLLDVNIPEGLTAYYLTSDGITETTINLTKYSGTSLKAGEGVIVSGTSNTSYQLEKATGEVQAIEGNQLKGCTENTTLTAGEAYLLAKNSDGTAAVFKKCAAGTLAQGKAYLPATSASKLNQAQEIRVDMGGTTAITSATISSDQDSEEGASYSLTGQRVSQQYKGIVIRNGKKFLK
ncbi:MAG: hypothetical protein HUK08_02250 [Bacteroidaceae bacterium]|nr:hypothetical protein [Bacteroidaceae bacterium]